MLCFRQRFLQTSNLFVLCSLLLAAGFMLQIKVLYNNYQKQLRLQEYKHRLNDVTETINSVEKLANYTSSLMKKLEMATKPYKFNKTRLKLV
ncbi:hypothetical protein NQ315_004487 [Exocentrus adspersus]|uniref:Uncharacterized protein n=1 Tax=Exocentrus adspersus TaxID=1586481 RepID=A0AAV8VQ13_9CUCU|nr:hypothetical protein NQ315_004487 [Exocentrus adspersus]